MSVILLIRFYISKVSTNIMSCSGASLTCWATSCYPFEGFYKLQKSLVLNAFNASKHNVTLPKVAWKLIFKQKHRYDGHINILEDVVILVENRRAMCRRAHPRHCIIVQTDFQVLYHMLFRSRCGALRLCRFKNSISALCLVRNLIIYQTWSVKEKNPADVPSRLF